MKTQLEPLIRKALAIKPLALFSLALRVIAMIGKFAFILIAVLKMTPADLGRYGVATSLAMLIPGIVGIEAYQILCRQIANGQASDSDKANYSAFTFSAAATAFIATFVVLMAMSWNPVSALIAAGVVASEHLGNELFRMLVAEGRRFPAFQCFSIRSGLWSVGLPLLSFTHVLHGPWSLNLVLLSWLAAGWLGLLYAISLPHAYRPNLRSMRDWWPWLKPILPASMGWLGIATAWKFIDSGPKLLAGIFLSPAEAGHFTFLNTMGTIPTIVIKGVIEPMFFIDLAVGNNAGFRRRYGYILAGFGIACTIGAAVLLFGYTLFAHKIVTPMDWMTFAVISSACVILNMSQQPHFVLYANRHDRLIFYVSIATVLVAAPVCSIAAWAGGRVGLAFGTLFMACILLGAKWFSARMNVPEEYLSRRERREAAFEAESKVGAEA